MPSPPGFPADSARTTCCSSLQLAGFPRDQVELLLRRQPVRRAFGDAFAHLPGETGNAHHEELVEIVGRYRQETHPLEQRMLAALRASSSTRQLNCSQENSRLTKRVTSSRMFSDLSALQLRCFGGGVGVSARSCPLLAILSGAFAFPSRIIPNATVP
jgi:hypothetical protein